MRVEPLSRVHPFWNEIDRAVRESKMVRSRLVRMSKEDAIDHGYTQSKLHSLFCQGYQAVAIVTGDDEGPIDYTQDMNAAVNVNLVVWNIQRDIQSDIAGTYVYSLIRFERYTE